MVVSSVSVLLLKFHTLAVGVPSATRALRRSCVVEAERVVVF